jgi:hypothetical protein
VLTFDAVVHAPIGRLEAAADRWKASADNLDKLGPDVRQQIVRPVVSSGWSGEDATAGMVYMDRVVKEVRDAAEAALAVHRILDEACARIKEARDELVRIRDVDAPADGLTVHPDGTVEVSPATTEKRAALAPGGDRAGIADPAVEARKKIPGLQHRIQTALEKADIADEEAARALRADTDGDAYDFRPPVCTTLAAAEAARAADLAAKGEKLTDDELLELDRVLAADHDDMRFATDFATRLGARGTLTFWTLMANPASGTFTDERRYATVTALQQHLGLTLATAGRSGSAAMRQWKQDMIGQGGLRVPTHRATDTAPGPFGYQVMSSLMRYGRYDRGFLLDYGTSLVDFERRSGKSPNDLWIGDPSAAVTTFTFGSSANDVGHDPMTGLMDALSHNPAAATDFFKDQDTFAYLTGPNADGSPARAWPLDSLYYANDPGDRPIAGYDHLGHALEAATTGAPYPNPHHLFHRTADTTAVAREVVRKYGNDASLIHTQSGIADSIGRVGAAYIDDIDNAVHGNAPGLNPFPADGRPTRLFGNSPQDQQDAIHFLSMLGQDRTAHGIVSAAQHAYTASILVSNPPGTDGHVANSGAALTTEAYVRGILDRSRVAQATADYGASADQLNQELSRSTDYLKLGTGTLVGVGVGLIPVPGANAVGAAVVPIAAETAGEAFSTFLGHKIDDMTAQHAADAVQQISDTKNEFFLKGWSDVNNSYQAYVTTHGSAHFSETQREYLLNELKGSYYATGPNLEFYQGVPSYEGN